MKLKRPSRSNVLDGIRPVSEVEEKVTMVLYGRSGTGKTTFSGTFPKPILLVDIKEGGTSPLKKVKSIDVLHIEEWKSLNDLPYELADSKYKSIVIDSISMAQTLRVQEMLRSSGKNLMTQQNWGEVGGDLQRLILTLRDLPQHILFIAHDRTINSQEEGQDQLEPEVGPALIPSVSRVLCGAVSVVGNSFIKEVKKKDGSKIRKEMQYRLRLGPHAYYLTKVRTPDPSNVPASIVDPTFDKLVEVIKGA